MVTKKKTTKKTARKRKGNWGMLGLSRKYIGVEHKKMGLTERDVLSKKTGFRWGPDSTNRILKRKKPKFRYD